MNGNNDTSTSTSERSEQRLPALTAMQLKTCDDAVANLTKAGTLRTTSDRRIFEVDENAWVQTEAADKRLILIGLACAIHRKQFDALTSDEFIWINGVYSGKRVARISSYGPNLDP